MPLATYSCRRCGHKWPELRTFAGLDAPVICVACSSTDTERPIGAPITVYHAKGFYTTDSKIPKVKLEDSH